LFCNFNPLITFSLCVILLIGNKSRAVPCHNHNLAVL
jgi:hypothetical protein